MQGEADNAGGVSLGRMSLDKKFAGDLQAVGKGEMLSARSAVEGSAGYVAIERVTGTLQGRQGSFVFQHTGVMNRRIAAFDHSCARFGTEELTGIAGEFCSQSRMAAITTSSPIHCQKPEAKVKN